MAAMTVSAGPAQANETNFESSTNCVQGGDGIICGFGDGDFGDVFGFGDVFDFDDNGIDFDGNGGFFGFGGIEQDSDSGELSIGSDVS
jgi:hypothetical protein